ncbi:MAG: hypothetical protein VX434_01675 [Pseudomonadota bacterium]|nr:hypothetical protein [Pseudomonadota bacterium]|tara:strand:- start:90 stop:599 length:510 start_codon:yes stop_codon:yes gene_type:complete
MNTLTLVAIAMWMCALALMLVSYRRQDGSTEMGLYISLGYLAAMVPRALCAVFMASFATELLPGDLISGWLGSESGIKGILIASVAGILVPAGGVVAFPLALAMIKLGVGVPQLTAFLTSWEVFAIHRILAWEIPFLGLNFVGLRVSSSFMLPPLAGIFAATIIALLNI